MAITDGINCTNWQLLLFFSLNTVQLLVIALSLVHGVWSMALPAAIDAQSSQGQQRSAH